ncbi:MAG: sulfatase, partial [Verrucomicrobiota bacterium]
MKIKTTYRAFFVALSLLSAIIHGQAEASKKPNILLIISDDLRDRLGCYGASEVFTPNIDALAKQGIRFENAYDQYSVCDPSRSSFLTGLRPEQTGVWDNSTCFRTHLPDAVTLPHSLRNGGYYTASFGKVFHVGPGAKGVDRDVWVDAKNAWNQVEDGGNSKEKPKILEGRNMTNGKLKWCEWGASEGSGENDNDYINATAAIEAMKKSEGKRWFIAVGFHKPHDPFICPKKYFDLYPLESLKLYKDPVDMTPTLPIALPGGATEEAFKAFSDQDRREFMRAYYACTSYMDAQVGRVLDGLKESGSDENTIIIFMGDNGYHLGEREWWNKVTLFERCARIPFIVAGAGVKTDQVCKSPIELVDIYPTLMERCGVEGPQNLAGSSFSPLLVDPSGPGKGYAMTMVTRGKGKGVIIGRSVRTDRWRYTEWDGGRQGIELYDESKDPEETHDESKNPEYKKIIES